MVTFRSVQCNPGLTYTFLISDIRELWCSGLSDRVPECQKFTMWVRPGWPCVCQLTPLPFKVLNAEVYCKFCGINPEDFYSVVASHYITNAKVGSVYLWVGLRPCRWHDRLGLGCVYNLLGWGLGLFDLRPTLHWSTPSLPHNTMSCMP